MAKKKKNKKNDAARQALSAAAPKAPFWTAHPGWTALGFMTLLLVVFYYPIIFQGKTLLPPDTIASRSFQAFSYGAIKMGTYPLWNPFICSGMPSFASLSSAPFLDLINTAIYLMGLGIFWLLRLGDAYYFTVALQLITNSLLLGAAVYLLLKHFNIESPAAFYASAAMVFLPQVIAYPAFGHNSKLNTLVFIPFILMLLQKILSERKLLHIALMGLAVGMQLMRAHVQICYYTYLMIAIYTIYWLILKLKDKENSKGLIHSLGMVAIALLAGFLYSSVMSLSVWEYADYSIRGGGTSGGMAYSQATDWSFPVNELTTYVIPSFMGFGKATYWGAMRFTDFPLYFGIVTLMLAGIGLITHRNRQTRFFAILAGTALFISFGKHLPLIYGPMFKFMPLFNKFRAPKMIQIILMFSMVILSGFGIQGILNLMKEKSVRQSEAVKRYFLIFGGMVILLLLILLFGKSAYLGWAQKIGQHAEAAYDKALSDGFKALFFWAAAFGVVMMALKNKIKPVLLPALLIGLLLIDVWPVSKRFLEFHPKGQAGRYFAATPEVTFLKEQEQPFRMMGVQDRRNVNWYMTHGLQNAFGYQGAKLRLYEDLTNAFQISPDIFFLKYLNNERNAFRAPENVPSDLKKVHDNFLDLMHINYIVSPYPLPDTSWQMVYMPQQQGANGILAKKNPLPRAWFPQSVKTLKDDNAVLSYVTSPDFDPRAVAYLEEKAPFDIDGIGQNTAEITKFDIHRIAVNAHVESPGCLILSEMYYPAGWKACVNGKETPIYKTNFAFRSIFLEPGDHEVEFIFQPVMFQAGFAMSLTTLLLLLTGIALGVRQLKQSPKRALEVES